MLTHLKRVLIVFIIVSCGTEIEENFCPGLDGCSSSSAGGSSSTISYSTFFTDDFNRANESPMAAPWNFNLVAGDNISILTNEVLPSESDATDTPGAIHTTNITSINVRVSISARIGGAGYAGEMRIYLRSQSNALPNDTYFCGIDPGSGALFIGKRVAGVASALATSAGAMTYDNGDTYTLTFTGEGTSLSCALTGSDSLSVTGTDSDYSSGYIGIAGGENGNNVLFFDDLLVETGS